VTFSALSKQRSMRDKFNAADDAGEDGAQVQPHFNTHFTTPSLLQALQEISLP
jgi:hypothetical protein